MLNVTIDTSKLTEMETWVRDTAKQILSGSELKKEVGEFAVERLKYQGRTGKPFNSSDNFPELKPSTVRHRKYLAKYNPTHPVYSEDFSNLTITGEFWDSLTWLDEGDTLLKLAFTGVHKVYLGAKGQRISKPIMNDTLAKYLVEKGFMPFDKSLSTNKQFISRIKNICLGYIRRGLKIRNKVAAQD